MELLSKILSTRRAHNSVQELEFVAWLRKHLAELGHKVEDLPGGCFAVTTDTASQTMFSCHVDTVHSPSSAGQTVFYDEAMGHVFLGKDSASNCLGADDGAGVWLMVNMIAAKVPGTYVFHRGEEVGCVGSRAILTSFPAFLSKFKACVAFDRPDNYEVIIKQSGLECASEVYGTALATALSQFGMKYEISDRGVITDSKIYREKIRECVNIGVGYYSQHTPNEYLDFDHLVNLLEAVKRIDWDKLPVARELPRPVVYKDFMQPSKPKVTKAPPSLGFKGVSAKKQKLRNKVSERDLRDYTGVDLRELSYDELLSFAENDYDVADSILDLLLAYAAIKAERDTLRRLI